MGVKALGAVVVACLAAAAACGPDPGVALRSAARKTVEHVSLADVVIKQSDLPAGWRPDAARLGPLAPWADLEFDKCLAFDLVGDVATTDSPNFHQSNVGTVWSVASRVPDGAAMDRLWAELQAPNYLDCVRAYESRFLEVQELGGHALERTTSAPLAYPAVGDGAVAVRATAAVRYFSSASIIDHILDVLVIRKGRTVVAVFLYAAFHPFPDQLLADLGAKLAARA